MPLFAQEAEELDLYRGLKETLIPLGNNAKSPKVSLVEVGVPGTRSRGQIELEIGSEVVP